MGIYKSVTSFDLGSQWKLGIAEDRGGWVIDEIHKEPLLHFEGLPVDVKLQEDFVGDYVDAQAVNIEAVLLNSFDKAAVFIADDGQLSFAKLLSAIILYS